MGSFHGAIAKHSPMPARLGFGQGPIIGHFHSFSLTVTVSVNQCCERSFNRSVTDRERRFPFSNLRFRLTVFFIVLSLNTEKHYSTTLNKVYLRNLRLKCPLNPALNCAVDPA